MPARKPFLRGGERPLPSLLRCSIHLQRSRLFAAHCTQLLAPSSLSTCAGYVVC
jgi:hypothetical protein